MARVPLTITFAVSVALALPCAHAQSRFSLESVNVDLPPGDAMYPNGPGADAMNSNCFACHSADMVLNQPALSRTQWRAEVDKMQTAYRAPIDPSAIDAIVGYLASVKGVK